MEASTGRLLTYEEYLSYDDGTDYRNELVDGVLLFAQFAEPPMGAVVFLAPRNRKAFPHRNFNAPCYVPSGAMVSSSPWL